MAADAVDHALGEALSHAHPCATQELPLVGAAGYHALAKRAGRIAGEHGWTLERVTHLSCCGITIGGGAAVTAW